MSNEKKRYSGYQGDCKKRSDNNLKNSQKMFLPEDMVRNTRNTLPESVMNVESLFKLADFLETSKTDSSFPEITVIPNVLKTVGEFEMKINFLSDGVDRQYRVAMQKIQNETEIQLAQINGNVQEKIQNINSYYDLEMQKVVAQYNLKSEEMRLYYQDLEEQRKVQERQFNKMLKLGTIKQKEAKKAIREVEQVCAFYKQKIYNNTITREEREHYMELLKFRVSGSSSMTDIIPQLAAKIR